jgi:hypothetical protein
MSWKKGSFRTIHRNHWRHFRSNKIRGNVLLVALFLETGPGGAGMYTGLYYCALADISDYTGLKIKEVGQAIEYLECRGDVVYDRDYGLVFVRGMMQRQSTNYASTENNLQGVMHHVERMPEGSRAVQEFINAQSNVPELFELLEPYLEAESELESEVGTSQSSKAVKLESSKDENQKSIIAAEEPRSMTPASSTSSSTSTSTSETKGNGKAHPASNGRPDYVTAILKKLPSGQQVAIENAWKEIQEGKVPRPKVREAIKKVGWLSESELALVVPESGGPGDWLSEAAI